MHAKGLTPVLNVSDLGLGFTRFAKLGGKKVWDRGDPPGLGAVGSNECEIFLCQAAQGGRGNGGVKSTFGSEGGETADKGFWMSVRRDDLDADHRDCMKLVHDVTFPPTDMTWCVREMHGRHPDGHFFRISRGIDEKQLAD